MKDKNTDGIIIKVINGKEEVFYTNDYVFNKLRKKNKRFLW